jgi:hypothetical protein
MGNLDAITDLAYIYENGLLDVEKNIDKAI